MTGLALIEEVVRVETYLRVIAVDIIKPYLVMYYQPRLHATDLTDAAVYAHALLDKCIAYSLPCLGLIELLLSQHLSDPFAVYSCRARIALAQLPLSPFLPAEAYVDERR